MKRAFVFLVTLTIISSALLMSQPTNAFVCDSNTVQGNCVKYARTQVTLPATDLTYYQAKKNIINHRFPTVGSVAVMPAPGTLAQYGHVSVVRNVKLKPDGGVELTVEESNYGDCAISTRTVTPESRTIQGYFDPRYPSGQSSPRLDSVVPSSGLVGQQFYITATGDGFEASSARGMIYGGWCDAFGKCAIPNDVITNKSSTSLRIPVTITTPGTYTLYIFNSAAGKTSNGKPIIIKQQ
ncbi:MAG: hypothetical protein QOE77_2318 [Blastocatellia bacterium]|jgi:hypothetical protein|nr:hypothetical protein [Blastocatellia bacterium]